MQLNHYTSRFRPKTFPIILISDHVIRPANIGSLLRVADAFGIEKYILGGPKIELNRKVWNTSRSAEKAVNYEQVESVLDLIKQFQKKDYQIIAIEITEKSKPLSMFKAKKGTPVVVIIGSERHGICSEILKNVDEVYHIEMFGQNSSMNVVQATSIALYEITQALQQ